MFLNPEAVDYGRLIAQTITGIILGFSIAAPPGPINATVAQTIVTKKWSSGFLVALGATSADAIFMLLTYFGVVRLLSSKEVSSALFGAGAALMIFFAISAFKSGNASKTKSSAEKYPYFLGLTMGMTNPYQIGWWITVGSVVINSFGALTISGFFTGIMCWNTAYTLLLKKGSSYSGKIRNAVRYISASILLFFGVYFLYLFVASL